MGGVKQKISGGSLLVFVRKYSVVVICVFSFLVFFFFSFLGVLVFFFHLFFTRYEKGQTRREATILDERIQNFPFLSFIGQGGEGWACEKIREGTLY